MNRLETWLADKFHSYNVSKPLKPVVVAGLFTLGAAGIALVAALLSGVFQVITVWMQTKNDEQKFSEVHNVTSNNQSGGITAHTVNAFPKPRRLNSDKCESISNKLFPYRDRPILIDTILNDREAIIYAKDTESCLQRKGFQIEGIQKTLYEVPPEGQDIYVFKDKVLIKVGVAKRR